MKLKLIILACLVVLGMRMGTVPVAASEAPVYEMGFRNMTNLQVDLFRALDRKQQSLAAPSATYLPERRLPCIARSAGSSDKMAVEMSVGFVDFINRMAHAKAIDETERGFLARYTVQVARHSGNSPMPEFAFPPASNKQAFHVMNRQASHFNQMAGGLIAIDLAHQYLGHYSRQPQALTGDKDWPPPVNARITEQEWREAVVRGAKNALACGLGTDGLRSLFDSFGRMETRPSWAIYFIHPKANVNKISAELGRLERDFFVMNMELQKSSR